MKTRKRWTHEEDEMLIQAVKDNFDNLIKGFRKVSEITGRTVNGVAYRWYQVLSNPENKNYIGSSCFISFGIEKRYANRKNYYEGFSKQEPKKQSPSLWKRICRILGIK